MRKIKTTLHNILDLIVCAQDYGFENDVLFTSFRDMLDRELSNEEIESFSRKLEITDGYGEEDYKASKEKLIAFKEKYCNK